MDYPTYALKNATILKETYRITTFIGYGVFGFTYKAEHLTLPLQYVIKEFFIQDKYKRHSDTQTVEVEDSEHIDFQHYKNRFLEEATILAQFKDAENIVDISDYFEKNNTAYIVMPLVEAEDLERYLQNQPNNSLPEQEALSYIQQLCTALQAVHAQNILHRDIKPANVLRTNEGKIYLIDFGSAYAFTEGVAQMMAFTLTPCYAPPEQYHYQAVRSVGIDIYAVGALFYRLLVGQEPLDATQRLMGTPLLAPNMLDATISSHISDAIMKALAIFPQNRYPTISAFWEDLSKNQVENSLFQRQNILPDSLESAENNLFFVQNEASKSKIDFVLQNLKKNMVLIEGGDFLMGEGGYAAESHTVFLSSFFIGKYPVTQQEWQAVMGNNPSFFKGDNLPVEQVSWEDVQVFIEKLNEKTGQTYCLPSDAQWVYAVKGGQNFIYAGSDNPDDVAWSAENSGDNKLLEYWNWEKMTANHCQSHPVGQKKANGYGLYDMSGNVCEWSQDAYSSAFYAECRAQGIVKNPVYLGGGAKRVFRGGSWRLPVMYSAYLPRFEVPPMNKYNHLGFRLCRIT